jgi:hypothetical protein
MATDKVSPMCEHCGVRDSDCACEICETCSAWMTSDAVTFCDECRAPVCPACVKSAGCTAHLEACERCGEPSDDLAHARSDDWNSPDWCGTCRASMFAPIDIMHALTQAFPETEVMWENTGGGVYNVSVTTPTHVVRISEDGAWDAHEVTTKCAVVSVTLSDLATGDDVDAWAQGASIYAESVADVVTLTGRALAYLAPANAAARHARELCDVADGLRRGSVTARDAWERIESVAESLRKV